MVALKIIGIIIGVIVGYLAIGVLVAMMFFSGRSIHVGAAPLVYISPLIWPVLIPTMIGEKLDERASKKARAASAARHYAERMAVCPPGYEAPFTCYYAAGMSVPSKASYTHEEAAEAYFNQLAAGNLPGDPGLRKDILDMADYFGGSQLSAMSQRVAPLLSPEAPVLANYAGGYILIRNMRFSLDRRNSDDEPYIARALRDSARAFERYLGEVSSEEAPFAMGVLYGALAKRLPEGPERAASRVRAMAEYKLAVANCGSFQEIWCALHGLLDLGVEPGEVIRLLDELLLEVKNGRKLEKDMPDYDVLPLAWGEPPMGYHELHERILDKLLAFLAEDAARVEAARRLIPLVYAYNDRFSPMRQWREYAYDRYLESGNIAWADMFLRLAEDVAAAQPPEQRGGMRAGIGYYQAENAFMHGDEKEAARLMRQHYARDDNIGQFTAPIHGDPWGNTGTGQNFLRLSNAEYGKLMEERVAREGRPVGNVPPTRQ